MSEKVLFVDNGQNMMRGYQCQLQKLFAIEIAASGSAALEMVEHSGPYAVIIADIQMPKMNGIQLLNLVRMHAPHSVRMMLASGADQKKATDAMKEGHISRILSKPCLTVTMGKALLSGIAQYKLITEERGKKLRDSVCEVADMLEYPYQSELEIAALLSQIGNLTIPPDLLLKERAQMELSAQEQMPSAGSLECRQNLLVKNSHSETAEQIDRYRNTPFEDNGVLILSTEGEKIPQGSRILKVLSDLYDLEANNMVRSVAFRVLYSRLGMYDPRVLDTLYEYYLPGLSTIDKVKERSSNLKYVCGAGGADVDGLTPEGHRVVAIEYAYLVAGDVLTAAIETFGGKILLSAGNLITDGFLEKLDNYAQNKDINEPIYIVAVESPDRKQAA